MLALILWLGSVCASGECLRLVLAARVDMVPLERLSFDYALGVAGCGLLWFWLSLAGLPLGPIVPVVTGCLSVACLIARLRFPAWQPRAARSGVGLAWVLGAGVVGVLVLLLALAVVHPENTWDARTYWGTLGRLIYFDQTVRTPVLLDPDRLLMADHRQPLLVPLAEWSYFCWAGGPEDQWVRAQFVLFHAALLGMTWAALRRLCSPAWATALTLMLAAVPFHMLAYEGGAASGYADTPLACFVAGYTVCVLRWAEDGERGHLALATVLGAAVLFTRAGTIAWFLLDAVALGMVAWRRRRPAAVLAHLGLVCLLVTPWWIFTETLPEAKFSGVWYWERIVSGTSLGSAVTQVSRCLRQLFFGLADWGLYWWVFLASLLPAWKRHRLARWYTVFMGVGYGFVLLSVMAVWPLEFYNASSVDRYLLPMGPVAALAVGYALAGRHASCLEQPGP